ncbi:PREDICTED: probable WRKY transcription factor 75 [Nelumbo nucifera]|uniref:WRKY domain-containing protein n=2 Tax=Nelumbo nucifera TaxID=4432 RepID=A0A822YS11_NELNU|nr:PREDICTED: probable WRKY transcription factor 75 [Nelumbo nucifera]DAD34199.1 TPA_asm: hypothetical protein HUJ06_004839 [Nelumbo nucifera]
MENYSILFPCSSSSSAAVAVPFSSNMANSRIFADLNDTSPAGFLGLKTETDAHAPRSDVKTLLQNESFGRPKSETKLGINKKGDQKKIRKPRYAFQTRSQVDILDDGYRWRKYGQKAVKNNKFPRSYYRCTHQGCNVKKQVQRLCKDEGIVVTTYEGMHTHPIEKSTDNFEHILSQMQIYASF